MKDFFLSTEGNNIRTSQGSKQWREAPASSASSSCNFCIHPETCPCTLSVHSVWSRWGRSRPSFGEGSTSPRAVGWGGTEAWRGRGSGCAASCSGPQSRRAGLRQMPLRGSSLPPRGRPQRPDKPQKVASWTRESFQTDSATDDHKTTIAGNFKSHNMIYEHRKSCMTTTDKSHSFWNQNKNH